jgi:hypothetical protein
MERWSFMNNNNEVVFRLWCRLTGQNAAEIDVARRSEFFEAPQVTELSALPYSQLLDAGIAAASRGSLPLDRWLDSAHVS